MDRPFRPARAGRPGRTAARYWTERRLPTRDVAVAFGPPVELESAPVRRADAHALRALLYQHAGGPMPPAERHARSLAEVRKSLALDPTGRLAVEIGWPLFSVAEAKQRAHAAWQAHPHDWRVAVLAARMTDRASAVAIVENTRRWHARHAYLEGALALAYWGIGRYADAHQMARLAVEKDATDPYLLGVYGQSLIAGSACENGRERIAAALTAWVAGRRFPYDLAWLKQVCGTK